MLEEIFSKVGKLDILIILISAVAIVSFWRGIWNLLDVFLFPENFMLSQTISILVGVLILIILSRYK